MDMFAFLVSIFLIFLAIQYKMDWLIFGVAAILIVTTPNVKTIVIVGLAVVIAIYLQGTGFRDLWPFIMVGLVVVAYFLGIRPEQPQQGMAEDFSQMQGMEGMEGLGGAGGFGGRF